MDSFTLQAGSKDDKNSNDLVNNLFLSNLLSTLPSLDSFQAKSSTNGNMNGNSFFSNILEPYNGRGSFTNYNNIDSSNPIDIFRNSNNTRARQISPSTSPHTNTSSSGSSSKSVFCRCDNNAVNRCLDCNDFFCADCINDHSKHTVVGLGKITPIGSVTSNSVLHSVNIHSSNEPQCEIHGEALRFLCDTCKKIVCQECTLKDHREHDQTPIANITTQKAMEKLQAIHESSKYGISSIKTSIDKAVSFSQSIDRDSLDVTSRVKKAFRLLILAVEDRERTLLEQIEKYRQQKNANLSDQMQGLRSILAGLAETSDCVAKSANTLEISSKIDIAFLLANSENQLKKYAAMYENLKPKEENLSFLPPNFALLQDIRSQGEIVINGKSNGASSNGSNSAQSISSLQRQYLQQIQGPSNSPNNGDGHWDQANEGAAAANNGSKRTYASIVKPPRPVHIFIGQCIPGSNIHVSVKPAIAPTLSFCNDGPEDGKVSRPWGCCVNKNNEIIVADRRNNRVQVFFADGTFKFKFGQKGTGNGQFDLPAGVATDQNNRIIVVDKDNHRIQIFSPTGVFINKFGSYGKEPSMFMYPWAVAVNSRSQILVTDSRNHRIQLFSQDGHFISRFSFDGIHHSKFLKGLTTPRGVAFNNKGNIIVSDFENHRLIVIDSTMTEILATKGHEGSEINEFCRPSGICCDDDGKIVVADSKNQRVLIFSPMLEFLWSVDIKPSAHNVLMDPMDEKDRPSDVALLNDGRLVVLVETSPDSREAISPNKTFVQVF